MLQIMAPASLSAHSDLSVQHMSRMQSTRCHMELSMMPFCTSWIRETITARYLMEILWLQQPVTSVIRIQAIRRHARMLCPWPSQLNVIFWSGYQVVSSTSLVLNAWPVGTLRHNHVRLVGSLLSIAPPAIRENSKKPSSSNLTFNWAESSLKCTVLHLNCSKLLFVSKEISHNVFTLLSWFTCCNLAFKLCSPEGLFLKL